MARTGFVGRFPARDSAIARALAANVRRLRKERSWSQDELAAQSGIEQAAVSLIENSRANPTLLMLEGIAKALEVSFGELFETRARPRRPRLEK